MFPTSLWLLSLAVAGVRCQSSSSSSSSAVGAATTSQTASSTSQTPDQDFSYTQTFSTITGSIPTSAFTGSDYTYLTYATQSSLSSHPFITIAGQNSSASASSSSNAQITRTSQSESLTAIIGVTSSSTPANGTNATASSTTTSAAAPTNTLPCNNYPEFCNRQYSNITEVCAHNSAFAISNNAASNQKFGITTQLNDGVRMLQGETHLVNGTIYNCHTSCSLLNAGTWQSELETLVAWLERNPYDVVTVLIVNSDFTTVDNYVAPIQNSGIAQYLYEPAYVPQYRDQWPTLSEMILSGTRVVMFMDYNANQTAVPYILDEFSHIWETPFSPTNRSFPCTQQRPPNLSGQQARDQYMYLANHNLNTAISISAILGTGSDDSVLIPNTAEINMTNGQLDQYGQMGAMASNCTEEWDRPPTFLLVDYYTKGYPQPCSVFQVAAQMNNVTYTPRSCGSLQAAGAAVRISVSALAVALAFASFWVW